MIGAGDAAASLISPAMYRAFALPYERRVIRAVHGAGSLVKLHICGNTTKLLPDMARSGADLFNVDHMVSLEQARAKFIRRVGSVSRAISTRWRRSCRQRRTSACENAREAIEIGTAGGARYMLSAGCEVPAETPDEVFEAFC